MRTSKGEVQTAELGTFVGVGLAPSEAEALLSTLPENMVQSHVAKYATCRRIFPHCRVLQPPKNQRTRREQTLFGTVKVQ